MVAHRDERLQWGAGLARESPSFFDTRMMCSAGESLVLGCGANVVEVAVVVAAHQVVGVASADGFELIFAE